MRIARYRVGDDSSWGFIDGDEVIDASGAGEAPVQDICAALDAGLDFAELTEQARAVGDRHPIDQVSLLAPIQRPRKFIGLARNYTGHGGDPNEEPILFGMLPSSIVGPGEAVVLPRMTEQVNWEAELAIVISRTAQHVPMADALSYVAGYTIVNDVSARDPQIVRGQLFHGKAFDTFKPMGPVLTTVDELGDAAGLPIRLWVNGVARQDATTALLVHGVPKLIEFCSAMFTLEPGDVIATGTPGAVSTAEQLPRFLSPGDRMEVEIEGIGRLSNPVIAAGVPEAAD